MTQSVRVSKSAPVSAEGVLYVLAILGILVLFLFPLQRWVAQTGGRWLYILLFSCLLSFLLVRPLRSVARNHGILDHPDVRKLHGEPTPLLGGVAIYVAFAVSLLANSILTPALTGLLVAGTAVVAVSLLDDVRPLPARLRLVVIVLATLVVIYSGTSLTLFPTRTLWGQLVNVLLTIFWIVGITSAMNFFDGMDGLAGGLAAVTAFFLGVIAYQSHQVLLGWVSAAMLGSTLGFLPYNFRPGKRATVFLGDAGSNFLGFVLASLAVLGDWAENNLVDLAAPLLIFGVFVYDMTYITLDRVFSGRVRNFSEWIEYVGRDHLHHRLEHVLGKREYAVVFILGLSCALSVGATVLLMASPRAAVLLIPQAIVILAMVTILERRGRRPAPLDEPAHGREGRRVP
ncbi:MAG: undecaprenyl/decaprenyl-phosphate alpha-N-acetylglucosaminyl 1-phosphate transferase [Candidatus Rokubacteria bacterium]|nr:undecaprenyl/decaprenyl-phosphate alpha-N-acetylglucosaminyl 1-phosphate transferase [Candidatus Rokubacteria bacterium]